MKVLTQMKSKILGHYRAGSAVLGGDDFDYSMIPDAAAEIVSKFIPKPKSAATPDAGKGGGDKGTPPKDKGGGGGGHEEKSSGWLGVPYWVWALGGVIVVGGTVFLLRRRAMSGPAQRRSSAMLRLGGAR